MYSSILVCDQNEELHSVFTLNAVLLLGLQETRYVVFPTFCVCVCMLVSVYILS